MFRAGILIFFAFSLVWAKGIAQTNPLATQQIALFADTLSANLDSLDHRLIAKNDSLSTVNLISFARTLKGIRYKYACADPKKGFDCSGFVMYVFNHFQMTVPRSSIGYTKVGKEIKLNEAVPGDVILFTGANAKIRKVGHVGIITQVASDSLVFIHASSGKTPAVIETQLNPHYRKRFIKVVRVMQ